MAFDSYRRFREFSFADPRKEMRREKERQVEELFVLATDREDNVLKNGVKFKIPPRIFEYKSRESIHSQMAIEVLDQYDTIDVGDYIRYDDCDWIILNVNHFHDLYRRGTMEKCNRIIRFCRGIMFWLFDTLA